jgi:hypothetical protein
MKKTLGKSSLQEINKTINKKNKITQPFMAFS